MTGPGKPIPAGDVARVDQIAAQLAEIVDAARRHMASCPSVPAGICVGETTEGLLHDLSCGARFQLLEEAVAQLARAEPPNGPVQ